MMKYTKQSAYLMAMSLTVSGCELLGPELHQKIPLEPVNMTEESENSEVLYQELSNENNTAEGSNNTKTELYPGTGNFTKSSSRKTSSPKTSQGEYSLNFDDADLGEVAKVILSDILGENYVLSPKVAGKVTLQTSKPLSKSELLPTLEMLLQMNNAALVYQDGMYHIEPITDAISNSAFSAYNNFKKKTPSGYQTLVIPVKNVAAEELAEIIKPLLKAKTILHVDRNRNMMFAAGGAAELNRLMEIVNTFDINILKGKSFGLFPLQNVDPAKMIEELEQILANNESAKGFYQFMEIERLNSILVITHQAKYLKQVERWILRLDRANTATGGGVNVYRVQHVEALVLAETLNQIFSESGSKNKPASVAAGRKSVEITNKKKNVSKTKSTRITRKSTSASIADIGDISIIADEINNALIIVATAQDYAVIHRVIKQLDVMPLQVLIDVTIVDVTLDDQLQYGIKWFIEHANGQGAGNSGGIGLINTASSLALAGATGGLSEAAGFGYGFVSSSGDIKAVLSAESNKGNINIVSSPSLMVLNNQEANIQVGEETSLRTSESTNTSGGAEDAIVTSTIQQRKTGVTVNVKPRVNANGLVIMEVEQKVEDFAGRASNGNPNILTREIKSSIAVQSGETIVLGGLISEKNTHSKGGIPFLYEIPLIGPLFGTTSKENKKSELVVLITPRVVKSRLDARLVTDEFKRKLSGIYDDIPIIIEQPETQPLTQ